MKCALWLNRRRVFSAEEIPASFDLASLRGYFLAGSLVPWLEDNGGAAFAEKLRGLSADDAALNARLTEVFCGVLPKPAGPSQLVKPTQAPFVGNNAMAVSAQGGACSFGGSGVFGSFGGSWGNLTSYKGFGSMSWERWGSALGGSLGGSWGNLTSYKGFGSMSLEHWGSAGGSFGGSFAFDRFLARWERVLRWEQPRGSFAMLLEDEYDRILMLTLAKCPLDRYGYGIHVLYD